LFAHDFCSLFLMKLPDLLAQPNGSLPDCLSAVAQQRPEHPALILNGVTLNYRDFDQLVSRAAASLQRDGVQPGDVIAACAGTSLEYVALYFGVLRAGGVMTPLPPSATAQNLTGMLANSGAQWLFLDQPVAKAWNLEGVEAFVHVGTNLPVSALTPAIEAEFGKPLIGVNVATYWWALRRLGIQDPLPGFGVLAEKY
jgi:acyl-CoA synthetase (AMP-forming)/AMP-acid ligase II